MAGFNFAPVGWAFCNGALVPISENDALFNLIGTTYGGDGQQTFGLPDLQSRVPLHQGQGPGTSNYIIGQFAGVEEVTLIPQQLPVHNHAAMAKAEAGNQASPNNAIWAGSGQSIYGTAPGNPTAQFKSSLLGNAGGNQPHENMMPFTVVNFIISLFGVFPSQN